MTMRAEPDKVELRPDRPYDEQSPGHVVHPNGSLVSSEHRGFLGAAGRAVFAILSAQRDCKRAPFNPDDWHTS